MPALLGHAIHQISAESQSPTIEKKTKRKVKKQLRSKFAGSAGQRTVPIMETTLPKLGEMRCLPSPACDKELQRWWSILGITKHTWTGPPINQESHARPFKVATKVNLHHLLSIDDDKEHFKLIFDIALLWEDPWLKGARSTVSLMNGRKISGIIERKLDDKRGKDNWLIVKPRIVKPRESSGGRHSVYSILRGADNDDDEDEEEFQDEDVMLECPGHLVHHIDTKALKELSWSPLNKFTLGTITEPEQVQVQTDAVLWNGMKGQVRVFTKYIAEFKAALDMRDFPFDEHKLTFNISSAVPETDRKSVV